MKKQNSAWISDWRPDDEMFWTTQGKAIARRNLIWSIATEHLGFSIWLVWSIVATKLPQAGFLTRLTSCFSLWRSPGWSGR